MERFSPNNIFFSYDYSSFPAGVILAHTGAYGSMLNYGILLYFPEPVGAAPHNALRTVPPISWPLVARHGNVTLSDLRSLSFSRKIDELSDLIIQSLQSGVLQAFPDMFYVPFSSSHRVRHFRHDLLITSAQSSGTVACVLRDGSGEYITREISADIIAEALISSEGYHPSWIYDTFDNVSEYGSYVKRPIWHIDRFSAGHELDVNLIRCQVVSHLESKGDYRLYVPEQFCPWPEVPGVFGLAAEKAFLAYTARQLDRGHAIDYRGTRLLWEHKLGMTMRVQQLRTHGYKIRESAERDLAAIMHALRRLHLTLFLTAPNERVSLALGQITACMELLTQESLVLKEIASALEAGP